MKKIFLVFLSFLFFVNISQSDEWKMKNKWKVSCGIVDKEALVVNGKPKKSYNKNEFKIETITFKLDKGDIGKCKNDKKKGTHGGYGYAGRQEVTTKLYPGKSIFETDLIIKGDSQHRSTIFQIHDGRDYGAPPSWVGVGSDWKIKYKFAEECKNSDFQKYCEELKEAYFYPDKINRFRAEINYNEEKKVISVFYYLNDDKIAKHVQVPILKKKTDGPYGPNKPYIKIGIYRIGETGSTSYKYDNLVLKNKKQ
tara:strand:+ start:378 stop:1136 length:759 start_codon:yes stop_codon:yes gene_type:complete